MTNGEFLADLAKRIALTSTMNATPRFTGTDDAERLYEIAKQMLKDEKESAP